MQLPHDPERGEPGDNRGAIGAPAVASIAASASGVTVAWQSNSGLRDGRILVARSDDAGASWSSPATVASPHAQAFTPELDAGATGTLGLSWYDLRSDRAGDRDLTAQARFAHSHDGGASWTEVALGHPFDLRRAPSHYGNSLGSRQGLAPAGIGFAAAFVQAPPESADGPSDVYVAALRERRTASMVLRARPRRVPPGVRTQFSFRVTAEHRPVTGARIGFAGHTAATDERGRAVVTARLSRPGRYRARASKRGLRPAQTTITVRSGGSPRART
jgi:hypothetical protein